MRLMWTTQEAVKLDRPIWDPTPEDLGRCADRAAGQPLDHEALLRKYIAHVVCREGTDFLSSGWEPSSDFTKEEFEELWRLADR
jgi:hypothetical protein